MKKGFRIFLAVVALAVFGMYAIKINNFRDEMATRRAEVSMEFLDQLKTQRVSSDGKQEVLDAFNSRAFDKLESLAKQYSLDSNDPEGNGGKISVYFGVLGENVSKENKENQLEIVESWRKKFPNSIPARIVHAKLLMKVAWNIRGDGYARTVSEKQAEGFRGHLLRAVDILKSIPEQQRVSYPECYANMLTCARGLGVSRQQFHGLYMEGVRDAPKYQEIHFIAAHFSTVQWGAELGEWERNLREAIKGLPKDDADEIYAVTIYRMVQRGHFFSKAYDTVNIKGSIKGVRKRFVVLLLAYGLI